MIMPGNNKSKPVLELRNVHAAYVKKEILRGVSLAVHRGEVVALVGGNGSGKTTVLKTIAGLLEPTKGSVIYNGVDITHESAHYRQQGGIGLLLQGGRVFPNLSVEENFEISARHRRRQIRKDRAPELGEVFPELGGKQKIRAGLLSGGQKQMLAVEMVLAQDPVVVLLDEPSAGLAPTLAMELLRKVALAATSKDMAVLLVEQNVEEARRNSNRQLRLDLGVVSDQKWDKEN